MKFVEIRYIPSLTSDNIKEIQNDITYLYQSSVKSIQIITHYKYTKELYELSKLKEFDIVANIVLFNSPYDRGETWEKKRIEYVKKEYKDIKYSNNNYNKNFILDLRFFMEAHYYNPYYFKRVCIDSYGNIKNCLKNDTIFGNIKKDNLLKVIHQKDFRELWYISPDRITDIRDSPLRYNMYITNNLIKADNGLYQIA